MIVWTLQRMNTPLHGGPPTTPKGHVSAGGRGCDGQPVIAAPRIMPCAGRETPAQTAQTHRRNGLPRPCWAAALASLPGLAAPPVAAAMVGPRAALAGLTAGLTLAAAIVRIGRGTP